MRGMMEGEWYVGLARANVALSGIGERFATPASVVASDHDRLRECPQSYCLCVAHAWLFAHRTLLARAVTSLELPITCANPWLGGPQGWQLQLASSGPVPDVKYLWQVYLASNELVLGTLVFLSSGIVMKKLSFRQSHGKP